MNIVISASELAILTGHNSYRPKSELYIKYWQRYFKQDFERISYLIKKSNKKVILPETAGQTVSRLAKEHNIKREDVSKLFNASREKSASKMNSTKKSALDSMLKQIPKNQQELLTKSANSVAYTNFGTKNETNGVKLFEKMRGVTVDTPSRYYKTDLFIIEEDNQEQSHIWTIGGKIDGLFKDESGMSVILEIKNRMKGLFKKLRDYEKVQCYAYMFALDLKCVNLAECYKKGDSIDMGVIEINWEESFWEAEILEKVSEFVDDFYDFLDDDNRKIEIISSL